MPPRLTLAPRDTCVFETREASQGRAARDDIAQSAVDLNPDLAALVAAAARHEPATGPGAEAWGHALTGPVFIAGAEPDDTLLVEIVEVLPG